MIPMSEWLKIAGSYAAWTGAALVVYAICAILGLGLLRVAMLFLKDDG
jgi:hypothetical protein